MKRLLVFLILLTTLSSAVAWSGVANQGTRIFAKRYLTDTALKEYNHLLKIAKKYPAEKPAAMNDARWGKVSLDAYLRSTTSYEGDVVVQLERAANVLRNRTNYSEQEQVEALRSIYRNMVNLHDISSVNIEGNKLSGGFTLYLSTGEMAEGKSAKPRKSSWRQLWNKNIIAHRYGFTSTMYADELAICHGKDKAEFSAGTIRDWATDMGKEAQLQLSWAKADMVVDRLHFLSLEEVVDRSMAKAGYRLAALLNEVLK